MEIEIIDSAICVNIPMRYGMDATLIKAIGEEEYLKRTGYHAIYGCEWEKVLFPIKSISISEESVAISVYTFAFPNCGISSIDVINAKTLEEALKVMRGYIRKHFFYYEDRKA